MGGREEALTEALQPCSVLALCPCFYFSRINRVGSWRHWRCVRKDRREEKGEEKGEDTRRSIWQCMHGGRPGRGSRKGMGLCTGQREQTKPELEPARGARVGWLGCGCLGDVEPRPGIKTSKSTTHDHVAGLPESSPEFKWKESRRAVFSIFLRIIKALMGEILHF